MINLNGTTTGYGANTAELANADIRIGNGAAPTNGLYSPAANQIAFSTVGTGRLFIASDGKVGIGVSAPGAQLHSAANVSDSTVYELLRVGGTHSGASGGGWKIAFNQTGDGSPEKAYLSTIFSGSWFTTLNTTGTLTFGTNNTERVRIDSSGRLLVGTSSSRSDFIGLSPQIQLEGATQSATSLSLIRNEATSAGPALLLAKSRGTTAGAATVVQSGDILGGVYFMGADGTNIEIGAQIIAEVDTTPGNNDMPCRLVFSATADGAASPTEAMRINNQRELLIGTTTRTANGGVLQISNGITFPGTQSACSDPNTLDDYEEGTWTPVISDGTNNATMNASTTGRYTKLGNQVTIFAYVTTTSLGSVSGSIRITGLPFTSSSINYAGCAAAQGLGLNITAGQSVGVRPLQSVTYASLYLWDDVNGTSDMLATEWSADGGIIFSLSYFV